jgi:CHASE3 domain sensor protein
MGRSLTFAQVVEAADRLTLDEQETLADLLRNRAIASRRRQLAKEVRDAKREHASGKTKPVTAEQLMREIRR